MQRAVDQGMEVDEATKEKYFGDSGRKAFYELYKDIFRQVCCPLAHRPVMTAEWWK